MVGWTVSTLCGTAAQAAAQEAERPNFLFIFSDDHAPHAIGAYGTRYAAIDPTPNIDRLASRGLLFSNAYTQFA